MNSRPFDDTLVRMAAFQHVRRLQETHDALAPAHLAAGFTFQGERLPLINPQRGIFKPRQMRHLLSIRTVYPRSGTRVWYDDQREVHRQIYEGDQAVDYAFMGENPDAADNRWLREAFEDQIPLIYFLGTFPARYQAIMPTFIAGWDRNAKTARVAFGTPGQASLSSDTAERRYALRTVKQRLHQASFRDAVIIGLSRTLRLVRSARAIAARCRPHRQRHARASGTAGRSQRNPAVQDPSRGVRFAPDRHRSRLPRSRCRTSADPE